MWRLKYKKGLILLWSSLCFATTSCGKQSETVTNYGGEPGSMKESTEKNGEY